MDKLRDFLKSKTGQILMALCLIPMAFMGYNSSMGGGKSDANQVAMVGKQSISLNELEDSVTNYRQGLIAQGADASMINEAVLKDESLKNLINSSLLLQQANKLGLGLSDASITKMLQQQKEFLDDNGQFSNELFANFLKSRNMTKDQLFAQLRTQAALDQLNTGVVGTSIYPISAVNKFIDLQMEARNLWVHRFAWQDFAEQVTVADSEIIDYYNQHKNDLQSVAMVDLSYIALDPNSINVEKVTEEDIQQQYAAYKQELNLEDMREVSQILLTGADAASRAQEVKNKLTAGTDFAVLAKQYSDDPSVEQNNGAMGRFNPEVFGSEASKVKQALNGLNVGDVSEPVTTSYGVQIFKVTANNEDNVPTIADVRPELESRAKQYKREQAFSDKVTRINELAVSGYSIQDIAEQEKVTAKTIKDYPETDNTTQLSQPIVIEKAFDDGIIKEQSVTASINVSDTVTVWVQPSNYRPTHTLTEEEAKPVVKQLLTKQKASELAMQEAEKVAKDIHSVADLNKGVKFVALGKVNRQSTDLSEAEKAQAFSKPAPDGGVATMTAVTEQGVSLMVADKLEKLQQSQLTDVDQRQTALIVRENLGQGDLQDYLAYLSMTQGVEINEVAFQ